MLDKIKSPQDLKELSILELNDLAKEIRKYLIEKMSVKGGHFGPNLGTVELEIALHYVFNSPKDKLVFDVSHQSYTHKMLTGRALAFMDSKHYSDVTGYTNPKESEHDLFTIGHTSTSISLALGLAKARDIRKEKYNVISIIGDGSLSGGEAFEGLDVAGDLDSNFIIIVNDNQMSIAENHGGIYKNLEQLRLTKGLSSNNLFKAFNLDYKYLENGNDIRELIKALNEIKDINHPIVLHINTEKGHGYEPSLKVKSDWHYTMPFDIETGKEKSPYVRESYSTIIGDILKRRIDNGDDILAIVAALPFNIGFSEDDRLNKYKNNFIDVGIAEQTAVAIAAGAAKGHAKSVFATSGSFLQRTFDQIHQDLCLDSNPATLLVSASSINGGRDSTHLGIFISTMLENIPNLKVLAPTSKKEFISMFNWSLDQDEESVAILIPSNGIVEDDRIPYNNFRGVHNKIEIEGSNVAIFGINDFYQYSKEVVDKLNEYNIYPTLINPINVSTLDIGTLNSLKSYKVIVTIEGYILDGGYGQKIASYFGKDNIKVLNYGLKCEVIDRFKPEDILKENNMTIDEIVSDILHNI